MTVFSPTDPGPITRPLAPRAPSERVTSPPQDLPSCSRHQTWDDDCGRCKTAIALRSEIRAGQHRRHIIGITRTGSTGRALRVA